MRKELISVVVVNDDPISSFLIECQLEESDLFSPDLVFHSGLAALKYLEEKCLLAGADSPLPLRQLWLIDINMPGMDGFELVESIRNLPASLIQTLCFCFLTFSENPNDFAKAEELGIDGYFIQPLKPADFGKMARLAHHKGRLMA